jgi:Transglutaminase-like superfamily
MWKAFQRYRKLDPQARKLFWRAVTLLAWVGVSLRIRGFQRTRKELQRRLKQAALPTYDDETLQRTCRMVVAAARHGFGHPSCLEQSLVLWYLLRRQNISARLRIGVRKQPGKLEAHAWVEHEDVPLNQSEAVHEHYAAFEREIADLSDI